MLDQITPLILTLNESPNIGRCLERLSWAHNAVVVDSFSSDDTLAIAKGHANVRLFQRRFDSHASQWNYGLKETGIDTEWVLALDADYMVSEDLLSEIRALVPADDISAYRVAFRYCVDGKALRGAVYPPVTVLFRRTRAEYAQEGHTQRVRIAGRLQNLKNPLFHDDRKSLGRWFNSQCRYMELEAERLGKSRFGELAMQDRVRKLVVIAPLAMFLYCMFVKGNILDGRAGLFYALQRAIAEAILSLYLLQKWPSAQSKSE